MRNPGGLTKQRHNGRMKMDRIITEVIVDFMENKKQLVIKNSPSLWISFICLGVVMWGAMIYIGCSSAGQSDILLSIANILTGAVLFAICIWLAFTAARIVTLMKEGVEIRAWAYRRFYTWDQMWFRKWHEYDDRYLPVQAKGHDRGYVWMSVAPVNLPVRPDYPRDRNIELNDPMARIRINIVDLDEKGMIDLQVERKKFLNFIDSIGLKIQDIDAIR